MIYSLIDGGVFANNPALCAYAEASKLYGNPTIENMLILSLGTGSYQSEYKYEKVKNWGKIQWAVPLIKILMSGVSETVDYQLRVIYKSMNKQDNYLRIQPSLDRKDKSVYDMDNALPQNINLLKKIGADTANDYFTKLDSFARILVKQ
jgi:patatin-like phospholipase/acyl hydrolase